MKIYDVVIVGAGPAGLMAARSLIKSNVDFLIIDSKKKIGLPLRCGETIREDGFLELFKSSKYNFIKNKVGKWAFYGCGIKRIIHHNYILLDRSKFEQWLSKPIKNKIKLKTICKDINNKEDYLEIITNSGKIKTHLVILAYGCHYNIQKKFGLIKKIPLLVPCYGGIFKSQNLDTSLLNFFFDGRFSVLWMFPKNKNLANVGIGRYTFSNENIKLLFKKAIKQYGLKLKGKPSFSGVFPSGGPIEKTYVDRLLVCGDAAGQVFASSGEGICFALKAGKLAGEVAVNAVKKKNFKSNFLEQYEREWKKSFGSQMEAGVVFSRILLFCMKYKLLKYILKFSKEKELVDLFWKGKIPLRARIFYYFTKLFNL